MTNRKALTACAAVQNVISRLEVDAVGVVSLQDCKGSRLEQAAQKLLPQARSVIVLAMEIYPEFLANAKPGKETGKPSLYDLMDRNYEFLNGRLTKAAYDIANASRKNGLKALPLSGAGSPSDARFLEAVFSYKHAAEAAGLGCFGRSSLILTPKFGPRARLNCCLTEVQLEPTKAPDFKNICESCKVCIENCPAGALQKAPSGEPYVINKFACSVFRTAAGGCIECMRLCPAGK